MKDNAINEIYSDFYHSIDTNSKYEIITGNISKQGYECRQGT